MTEEILQVIADYVQKDVSELSPQTAFSELGLDSLDIVELIMEFESRFNVSIEAAENIKTIGDLETLIRNN